MCPLTDGFVRANFFIQICTLTTKFALTWWRHKMETFFALLAFVRGIRRSPVNSPHKGLWRRGLMLSLIYARTTDLANNWDAGDLRRHRAHYDVNVMKKRKCTAIKNVFCIPGGNDCTWYIFRCNGHKRPHLKVKLLVCTIFHDHVTQGWF